MDARLQVGSCGLCIGASETLCLEFENSPFGQVSAKMQVPSLGACESPVCGPTGGLTPWEQCCPDCEGCRHKTQLLHTCPEMANTLLEGFNCFLSA